MSREEPLALRRYAGNAPGEGYPVKEMAEKIQAIKEAATKLQNISGGIQAVERNVDRILASVKMLEINISDISGIA
jgi:hypothetical protein